MRFLCGLTIGFILGLVLLSCLLECLECERADPPARTSSSEASAFPFPPQFPDSSTSTRAAPIGPGRGYPPLWL